jgi:hypothetical protein
MRHNNKTNAMKTSLKLDKIISEAQAYIYGGKGYNSNKFNTIKWAKIRERFEKEANNIGGVDYTLGDCLA